MFSLGDEVLMYPEKPLTKWVGRYFILKIADGGKIVEVNTGNQMIMDFTDKIKKI